VRFTVHVHPGARHPGVGGRHGDGDEAPLTVRVGAPAEAGRANEALRRMLADAFGVPVRAVRLVAGAGGRTKVVEIDGPDGEPLQATLQALRER
jgi:hypothetical protein